MNATIFNAFLLSVYLLVYFIFIKMFSFSGLIEENIVLLGFVSSEQFFIISYILYSHLNPAYSQRSINNGILISDIRKTVLYSLWKVRIHDDYGKVQHMSFFSSTVKGRKKMNKMFRFSDVKWLKQFLFKCKFDFLKDGTTSNCTLNSKMKINLKYGMNKVYVDFLGIIFYYENPDVFFFAPSILDCGQLCLGWNANIF